MKMCGFVARGSVWLGVVRGVAWLGLTWLGVRCRHQNHAKLIYSTNIKKSFQYSTPLDIGESGLVPSLSRVGRSFSGFSFSRGLKPSFWCLALRSFYPFLSKFGFSFCKYGPLLEVGPSFFLLLGFVSLGGVALPSRCLALPEVFYRLWRKTIVELHVNH